MKSWTSSSCLWKLVILGVFGLTGLSSDRGAKPFICRILHLFMSGGVVGCHTFCWSVAGIKDASHASYCASSQWLCLWGSVFHQCIFGLPSHSHRSAVSRTPPLLNIYLHEEEIIIQTPISSGYCWKVQRKRVTEKEYKWERFSRWWWP